MKKIMIMLAFTLAGIIVSGQATFKTNVTITKTTPTLYFNGTGGILDFNSNNMRLTHSSGVLTLSGGNFGIGSGSILGTGSLGSTGAGKFLKGWFTDLEITNLPTINGAQITTLLAAVGQTFYLGTTQIAINRSSAALTLAGITGIDGYSGSVKSPTTTGLSLFSGPTAGVSRTYTLPDANATILYNGGALGTPASGNASNLTNFPTLNQNTTGTANIAGGTLGAIPYQSGANATTVLAATTTANKVLMSGASAAPTWSTPTFPNASATSGKIIKSDGTNWIASTETYAAPSTSGNIMVSDGTNWTSSSKATAGIITSADTLGMLSTYIDNTELNDMTQEVTDLNLTSYSYVIDTVSGTVYARAREGSGLTNYSGTVAATVINQAIAALTSGGDIYFKRNNYTITTSIVDGGNSNINLIFERGAKLTAGDGLDMPVIYITGEANWIISNIEIDGNDTNQTDPDTNGDPETDGIKITTCTNVVVKNAYIHNIRRFGFYCSVDNSYCGIKDSFITLCGWNCITLGGYSTNLGLFAINNEVSHASDVGITTYGIQGRVINNYVHDIDGTTGYINSKWGIGIEGTNVDVVASYNIISGNNIVNTGIGIATAAYRTHNTISNNSITNISLGSFQGAMSIASDNNFIIGNTIQSTDADVAGIYLYAGVDETVIQNNRFIVRLGIYMPGTCDRTLISNNWFGCSYFGVMVDASTCDNTRIIENDFDASADDVDDSGTGTIYGNNIWNDGSYDATKP